MPADGECIGPDHVAQVAGPGVSVHPYPRQLGAERGLHPRPGRGPERRAAGPLGRADRAGRLAVEGAAWVAGRGAAVDQRTARHQPLHELVAVAALKLKEKAA